MKKTFRYAAFVIAFTTLASSLPGCGGTAANETGLIAGRVDGLVTGTQLGLRLNNGEAITITDNRSFLFPNRLAPRTVFNVNIVAQPEGQFCRVTNGVTGVTPNDGANMDIVRVTCNSSTAVQVSVIGLGAGKDLTVNDGTASMVFTKDGTLSFGRQLAVGNNYAVTITKQPNLQLCEFTSGSKGVIQEGIQAKASISCKDTAAPK